MRKIHLADDFEPHGAGRARDDVESGVLVFRIEVGLLGFANFQDLLASHLADFVLVRDAGTLRDAGRFFEQNRGGR